MFVIALQKTHHDQHNAVFLFETKPIKLLYLLKCLKNYSQEQKQLSLCCCPMHILQQSALSACS